MVESDPALMGDTDRRREMDAIEPAMTDPRVVERVRRGEGRAQPDVDGAGDVEGTGSSNGARAGEGIGSSGSEGAEASIEGQTEAGSEAGADTAVRESDLAALHASSFGWALTCCRFDRDEAEEVLQTSYLKILDGRARFEGGSSLKTFLFGVVRRTAGAQRRLRFARSLSLVRWSVGRAQPPQPSSPEVLSVQAEEERRLRLLLMRLSPRQREVLHLVFYQEMTVEEAAEIQRISVGAARVHYERGKAALRHMLRQENDR